MVHLTAIEADALAHAVEDISCTGHTDEAPHADALHLAFTQVRGGGMFFNFSKDELWALFATLSHYVDEIVEDDDSERGALERVVARLARAISGQS